MEVVVTADACDQLRTCCSVVQFLELNLHGHESVLDLQEVFEGQLVDGLVRHPEKAVHLGPVLKGQSNLSNLSG